MQHDYMLVFCGRINKSLEDDGNVLHDNTVQTNANQDLTEACQLTAFRGNT